VYFNIQVSVRNVPVHTLGTRFIIFGNTVQVRKATCISETQFESIWDTG